jgi:predicted RNA-binding protein with TRAM domain
MKEGGGFRPQRQFAPVKVGDEIDVKIEAVGEKGDGIAKVQGFVLFVPGVKEGEECKIRITRVLRKVGFAEKIGVGKAPEEGQEQTEEQEKQEYAQEEEQQESFEDTENFGEEQQKE